MPGRSSRPSRDDCELTDLAVCPFCGYEDPDSWELDPGETGELAECPNCGREYWVESFVRVAYSTFDHEPQPGEEVGGMTLRTAPADGRVRASALERQEL